MNRKINFFLTNIVLYINMIFLLNQLVFISFEDMFCTVRVAMIIRFKPHNKIKRRFIGVIFLVMGKLHVVVKPNCELK